MISKREPSQFPLKFPITSFPQPSFLPFILHHIHRRQLGGRVHLLQPEQQPSPAKRRWRQGRKFHRRFISNRLMKSDKQHLLYWRGHSITTSTWRGKGTRDVALAEKQTMVLTGCVTLTRGRSPKMPKILQTYYVNGPQSQMHRQ